MQEEIALSMGKLLKVSYPVTVMKFKYQILEMEEEIKHLSHAKKIPIRKRLIPLFQATPVILPIEKRIDQLKLVILELGKEKIDGVITPLTEADIWECRCHYTAMRLHLKKSQHDTLTADANQSFEQALEICCNAVLLAKQIECFMKKKEKEGDNWVRLLTYEQTSKLDPRILAELYNIYNQEFVLTDEQIKKYHALMMGMNN